MKRKTWKCKIWKRKIWNHKIWLVAAALALSSGAAGAETYTVGSLEIGSPWARATPKGAPVAGAYMTITNKGAETDRLMRVSSPVAAQVAVHQMSMDNGVMSMRPVQGGLEIKPGQTVVLNPDSLHLMLMGLKQPLTQGERVKVTLEFAKAGKIDLEYVVESMGAQGPSGAAPAGMDHGAMDHVH